MVWYHYSRTFYIFCVMHDHVTITVTYDRYIIQCYVVWQFVIVICDVMLTPNLKSQNKKINGKENRNEKEKWK